MKLRLKDIKPNPFRDFKIDPLDELHVDELVKSMDLNDYWGGVILRHGEQGPECAAGWHRIKARAKGGATHEEFEVRRIDDAGMRRIYAWENATQRGTTSSAVAGTIAAALRALVERELTVGTNSEKLRGAQKRDGFGRDAILAELRGCPGITENVVRQQLANLKASGDFDRIVREETAKAEKANAEKLEALREAEEERRDAEEREREAKLRHQAAEKERQRAFNERQAREKEAAREREAKAKEIAKRQAAEAKRRDEEAEVRRKAAAAEAREREAERRAAEAREKQHAATKATREAIAKAREKQHDVTFDLVGVSKHFRAAEHVEAFRRLALKHQQFLPVAQQAALAKRLVEAANDREGQHRGRLSLEFIEAEFLGLLSMAKASKRDMESAGRAAELARRSWEEKASVLITRLYSTASGLRKLVADLAAMEKTRPPGASVQASGSFDKAVRLLRETLDSIEEDLGYRKAEEGRPVQPGRKALV